MHPLESVPAVRRIDTNRPDLLAMEVVGHVSPADIENLYGLLEGAYALHDRIDLLLRVVEEDGVDWMEVDGASVKEAREQAARHIGRCAVVGNQPAIASMLRGLSLKHAETREFAADEEDDAWRWVRARPTAAKV